MKPAEPRPPPAAARSSYDSRVPSWSPVSTGFATPLRTAFHRPPPIGSGATTWSSGVPIGSSITCASTDGPLTVHTTVPGARSVPTSRNQAAPNRMMPGTLASVSTFWASAGGARESGPPVASSTCAGRPLPLSTSSSVSTTSSTPRRHGGAIRGNGGRPSTTSSSAVSSPKRYSAGPSSTSIATPSHQPAASTSVTASRRRATMSVNEAFVATTIWSAPTAWAAMSAPSSTR